MIFSSLWIRGGFGLCALAIATTQIFTGKTALAMGPVVCHSGCPYSTIQSAVDGAPSGSTITVLPGEYDESVVISKPVSLHGPQTFAQPGRSYDPTAEATVVGAQTRDGYKAAFTVAYPNVSIAGFTVGPDTLSSQDAYAGVRVSTDGRAVALKSLLVRNNSYGIVLESVDHASIDGTAFSGNRVAIAGARTTALSVGMQVPVTMVGDAGSLGIQLEWASYTTIGTVSASQSMTALRLIGADDLTLNGVNYAYVDAADMVLSPIAAPAIPDPVPVQPEVEASPAEDHQGETPVQDSTVPAATHHDTSPITAAAVAPQQPGSSSQESVSALMLPNTGREVYDLIIAIAAVVAGTASIAIGILLLRKAGDLSFK